jgi:sensor histidine kinase YesM
MYGTEIPELLKRLETETGAAKVSTYLYLALEHKFTDKKLSGEYAEKALEICLEENLPEAEIDYWTVRAILEEGPTATENAIAHLQKAVAIAERIGDIQGKLTALQKIGLHRLRQHKMEEAGEIIMQCVKEYEQLPDSMMKSECLHYAALYLINADLKAAAEMSLRGIEIVKHHGQPAGIVHHLQMLTKIATKSGDDDKAIEYSLEVLRIKDELNDKSSLLGTAKRLGQLYLKRGEAEQAQKFFEREIALHHADVNATRLALLQTGDAETYFLAGRKEDAFSFAKLAIEIANADGNKRNLGNAQFQMGQLHFMNESFEEAIPFLEASILTKGADIPVSDYTATLEMLHQCYERSAQFDKAYHSLMKKVAMEAELVNTERVKEVTLLNKRYETEKREAELRELKIKQQQSELQRTESELKAIKAQMNPHFIFNSLNSIQEMFFLGDKRLANEHLGQFSMLTRQILNASGKQYISLAEEIDMLHKYLQLEGLRFETDFSYDIAIDCEHEADDIMLPPMLIQPYIENAIRHGLLHRQGDKKVGILFSFDEAAKMLNCTIADNGIGREAAGRINMHRHALHESFATSANQKRLDLLNQNREQTIAVQYEDAAHGTIVNIHIPVAYD